MDKFYRECCIDMVNSIKCWDYADVCCTICPLNNTNYCNPNTALAKKYRMAAYRLECLSQKEKSTKKNWWSITYTDESGQKKDFREMPEHELIRIGEMVAKGYACGEIITGEES